SVRVKCQFANELTHSGDGHGGSRASLRLRVQQEICLPTRINAARLSAALDGRVGTKVGTGGPRITLTSRPALSRAGRIWKCKGPASPPGPTTIRVVLGVCQSKVSGVSPG